MSAALVLGIAGCTTVPRNTSPHVLRPFEAPQARIDVPKPRPNINPDLVLRDFYAAAAHPIDDYAAMRAFMTPDLAKSWNPRERARIVDGINLIANSTESASRQSFTARGNGVGLVGDDGAYEPVSSEYSGDVEMELGSDGQWRISSIPDGVVMEKQTFLDNNAPRNIYFLDPAGNQLVTERRWLYRGVNDGATDLMTKLKNGPSAPLIPGVTTVLRNTASISVEASSDTTAEGRTVNITGLGEVDHDLRVMLAAQIVWTLASADFRGPWLLVADGKPLVANHEGPWTKDSDEIRSFDPSRLPADLVRMRTVDNNGIYEVVDGKATPMNNGWRATGGTILTSAAVGVDVEGTELVAAVFRANRDNNAESTLMLGLASGAPAPVLTAQSLTRPSWSPDAAAVWTVKDGQTVVRLVRSTQTSQIEAEEIDTSELDSVMGGENKQISEFRVDPSGTQAAMIANGQVFIATIERSDSKPWKLTYPRAIALSEGVSPLSLTWSANQTLTIGAFGYESPMWRVYPDGATSSVLPKLNLTAPVTVVSATSSKLYALDTNALMELISGEGEEQFWRKVPGVSGRMAPVSVE
nr:LpqB family beta-propeller domain-containing protein [Corynebacterium lactis]